MYYDDEARRFNFASGLLLGAVLGTGLALLTLPQRIRKPKRIRRSAHALRRTAQEGLDRLPDSLSDLRTVARRAIR